MIRVQCPGCHKALMVANDLTGKKVKCPGCGQVMLVPGTVGAPTGAASSSPVEEAWSRASGERAPASMADAPTPAPSQSVVTGSPGPGQRAPDADLVDFLAPPQAGDELGRLGGFRILKVLGHGGMGVVFQGEDPKLGRKVAIKAMLPHLAGSKSSQQRFLREARTAAALEHDHIVAIHHVGEDRGAPFIVMPLLKGEPLDQRLRHGDQLPVAEVVRIGRETAEGLAAAHEAGLIHRDIKPANLWLEKLPGEPGASATGGRVKILDFGLARAAADDAHLTQTGAIVGTPAYMAPEQAAGENVGPRCDLFSLGCVLYRLCTGTQPFRGKDTISTLLAVATENPQPPAAVRPDVPTALSDLVMHLLAKKPGDRPASANAVVEALRKLEQQPAAVRATGPGPKPRPGPGGSTTQTESARAAPDRSAKKRPALPWLLGGGVLGLGVLGLLGFLLWPRDNLPSAVPPPPGGRPLPPMVRAPTGKEPAGKEPVPPRPLATDSLPAGSVWVGKRIWRNGRTFVCQLRVRVRDGARFKGHIIVGANEADIEGLLDGQAIRWHEGAADVGMTVHGTVNGDELHYTFAGRARGHGDLKRRDGS